MEKTLDHIKLTSQGLIILILRYNLPIFPNMKELILCLKGNFQVSFLVCPTDTEPDCAGSTLC